MRSFKFSPNRSTMVALGGSDAGVGDVGGAGRERGREERPAGGRERIILGKNS